jgi:hypothetical protein
MDQNVVFYSWQSWTDSGANRNFIEDCLERAIKEIRKDDSLRLEPVIDRDVQNVPGAADIANTILAKIEAADVFVADVSFVHILAPQRGIPNPNVLAELGYALGRLGPGKVVCVLNAATGRIEDLPFDIRGRAVATYELPPKEGAADAEGWLALRAEQRAAFVPRLKNALVGVLSSPDPELTAFAYQLAELLARSIVFGGEAEARPINPGPDELRNCFDVISVRLRQLACDEAAQRLHVVANLEEAAKAHEDVVHFRRYSGRENWEQYLGLVRLAVGASVALKAEWVDPYPLGPEAIAGLRGRLMEIRRQLDQLAERTPTLLRRPRGLEEVYSTAQSLGLDLCRFGQFDLSRIQDGLAARLSEIGRSLHLVGVTIDYSGGRGYGHAAQGVQSVHAGRADSGPGRGRFGHRADAGAATDRDARQGCAGVQRRSR